MQIALTFDDGPCARTRQILKVLKSKKVPATFFLLGKKINRHLDIVKQIVRQGCEIGNHTYSHAKLVFKSRLDIQRELVRTDKLLASLNIHTNLVRCPHLLCGINAFRTMKALGRKLIFADVDSRDWILKKADKIVHRVLRRVKSGSIVIFHCHIEGVGENLNIVNVLESVIPELERRGFSFVTISRLISTNA